MPQGRKGRLVRQHDQCEVGRNALKVAECFEAKRPTPSGVTYYFDLGLSSETKCKPPPRAINSLGSVFYLNREVSLTAHISRYRIFVASASLLLPDHLSSPLEWCTATCTIFRYAARAAQAQGFFGS